MKVTIESHSKSSGRKDNRGFSLVELIIVIAVMAILIGILAPQFIKYVEKSREAADLQSIDNMKRAVEAYVVDYGKPITSLDLFINANSAEINYLFSIDGNAPDSTQLEEYGISKSTPLKSRKWAAGEGGFIIYRYDGATYQWFFLNGLHEPFPEDEVPHADYYYADGRPYEGED